MTPSNFVDRLSRALGDHLSCVFLIAVAITAYEVVMRYVFNAATLWVTQTTIFVSAIGFIFGGAYALEQNRHIEITSIYDAASPRTRRLLDVARGIVAVLYLGCLLYATIRQAIPAMLRMETSGHAWDVPLPAYLKAALAIGTAVMFAQALSQLVTRLAVLKERS